MDAAGRNRWLGSGPYQRGDMNWFSRLTHKRKLEAELRKEVDYHLQRQADDLVEAGLTREEARRKTRLQFGGAEQVIEECRDARGTVWFESLLQDMRLSLRVVARNPGFTMTALAALALGIGANTAIFTVVNAVLLRPLPYPAADRLVSLQRSFKAGNATNASIPKYFFWKEHNQVLEKVAAYDSLGPGLNLSTGSTPEQVDGIHVSREFFQVFGVAPILGRTFNTAEDLPHGSLAAVVSNKLWVRRFGSENGIIGRTIDLSGQPYTVIGVMPAWFVGPSEADVWLPLQADPASKNQAHYLFVTALLKPGVEVATANAQLKQVMSQFRRTHSGEVSTEADEGILAVPLQESIVGDVRPALLVLGAAVCFVLLIACANMANLLLARAATRQRELAIRAAIGASRWRIAQQMLVESVLLSMFGASAGLVLGVWGVRALLRISPGQIPRVAQLLTESPLAFLDWRVFAFTFVVALLTGILFGLIPALRLSRPDLNVSLKEASNRSATGLKQSRARSVLVVSELAVAIVLLTGAGLLIRTFAGLRTVSTGLDTRNVLTFQTSLTDPRFNRADSVDRLERRVVSKIESLPGVTAAAATWMLPLNSNLDIPFNIVGHAPPKDSPYDGDVFWRPIHSHFFDVFKIPLKRGRLLNDGDTASSQPVVVINEAMAHQFWPKDNPVGQQIEIGKGMGPQFADPPRRIVGVIGDQREAGLSRPDTPVMYLPSSQVSDAIVQFANPLVPRFWVVRTSSDPAALGNSIREAVKSVDSRLAVAKLKTMDQVLAGYTERENFNMLLLSIFAGIALLLAAVGIHGLISYTVQQRTQEIGIRMALGARGTQTLWLVWKQTAVLVAIGLGLGIAGSMGVTRYMASLLFAVQPTDPLTLAAVAGALILVSVLATLAPVYSALRVDPMTALRYE